MLADYLEDLEVERQGRTRVVLHNLREGVAEMGGALEALRFETRDALAQLRADFQLHRSPPRARR